MQALTQVDFDVVLGRLNFFGFNASALAKVDVVGEWLGFEVLQPGGWVTGPFLGLSCWTPARPGSDGLHRDR